MISILRSNRPVREPGSPVPELNLLTRLLLWLAKADISLMRLCSRWSIDTGAATGLAVFLSALWAGGAMFYTLSTVQVPHSLLPYLSAAWVVFVGLIDREISGALDRKAAIVRPIVALFMGTIVAVPVELLILGGPIDQDLQGRYLMANKAQLKNLSEGEARLEKRRTDLEATLDKLRQEEAQWSHATDDELVGRSRLGRSRQSGAGPAYRNALDQLAAVRQRIDEIRRDRQQVEKSLSFERERLEREFHRQEVTLVTDFPSRFIALGRVTKASPALNRMSLWITLTIVLIEMCPTFLKLLMPRTDYQRLLRADMDERIARIDALAALVYERVFRLPESPDRSIAEKLEHVRFQRKNESRARQEQPDETNTGNY